MNTQPLITPKIIFLIGVIIALSIGGYFMLTMPNQRTDGQKIGNAIDEMSGGMDKAVRQLENRTPLEKLDDAAKDALNKRKDNNNPY